MSDLKELGSFLDPTLQVPFRQKTYEFQALDAETGLRLQKIMATGIKLAQTTELNPEDIELVSDAEEDNFLRTVLGETHDELIADKVPFPALKAIAQVVFMWTVQGFDQALEFWRAEGKAPTNRAARRTATRTRTAAASTGTDSRTTTKSPKTKAARGKTS